MKFFLIFSFLTLMPFYAAKADKKQNSAQLIQIRKTLIQKYGKDFLNKLKTHKINEKDFVYAAKLAKLGVLKLKNGSYEDALFLFNKAYSIVKSPNVLFYLAQTYVEIGNFLKARELFKIFRKKSEEWDLTTVKTEFKQNINSKIKEIESRLQRLCIKVNVKGASIYVNGQLKGKSPIKSGIYVMPGINRILVSKKGYVKKEITVKNDKSGIKIIKHVDIYTMKEEIKRSKYFKMIKLNEEKQKRALAIRLWKSYNDRLRYYHRANKTGKILFYTGGGFAAFSVIMVGVYKYYLHKAEEYPEDTPWNRVSFYYDRSRIAGNISIGSVLISGVFMSAGYYMMNLRIKDKKPPNPYVSGGSNKKKTVVVTPFLSSDSLGFNFSFRF